jgi:hypothetical protein
MAKLYYVGRSMSTFLGSEFWFCCFLNKSTAGASVHSCSSAVVL